jgi:phage-related protein
MISNIAYLIGFGLGTIVSFFVNLPGRILGAIRAIPGLVAGVFTAVWSTARSIVSSGISAVVGFFASLPGRARSAISALISIVSSVFSSAAGSARSGASNVVNSAINIIRGLPGKIRSALSTVRSAVTSAFAGAAGWLVSAGRNIIAGVKNGITSAISGAVSAARNAAKRIVSGFKDALSIGSPSKVMDVEVGRWIPAGVARGIEKNQRVVTDSIRDMLGPDLTRDLPGITVGPGRPRGGDGAALGGAIHVTIQAGAIVIQGQGREAGQEAAEAVLERLGAATLAR